ncbi:ribose-phosphate pyrophosphokinase [bacterium BMS3Abin05]|nr:ribose-phosphate pyrophosphokinase [bacterium BMS3Abin05]GBE26864.1 ribose-phosphate pyrophosphokinase [bacterium BMS3Bbin03]HDL78991.1 ribose-phosphate pyrophosphokinase [Bacteroidota bacterium]HDZ10928.1 ribose-phosphate pyrophosphokinase [Bacteroidota bacterium]
MNNDLKLFSGTANPALAERIADSLNRPLESLSIRRFSDGEIWVKYVENIRGTDVFLIQPTCSPAENILELLIMIDAAKRASARRVTAVLPYYGYARQDRKDQPRVSISSKLMANLITTAGADRVLTMDLHAAQIQGFFDIPLDHLYSSFVFVEYFRKKNIENLVVVSPDIGSIKMARAYSKRLGAQLALVDKRRPKQNVAEIMHIIGDVKDKNVLIVDDMVDTAGTLVGAAAAMKKKGARRVFAACTHALMSGDAVKRIDESPVDEMVVTDTIPVAKEKMIGKLKILSVSSIFAQAIERIHKEESISILFDVEK